MNPDHDPNGSMIRMDHVVNFCSCPVLLTRELSGLSFMLPSSPLVWEREDKPSSRRWESRFHGLWGPDRPRVAVSNGHRLIQVLMDGHGLAGQGVAPAAFVDLPPAVFDRHRVVLALEATSSFDPKPTLMRKNWLATSLPVRTMGYTSLNILADFKPEEAPLRPEAAALFQKHFQGGNREGPSTRCVPQGIPRGEDNTAARTGALRALAASKGESVCRQRN